MDHGRTTGWTVVEKCSAWNVEEVCEEGRKEGSWRRRRVGPPPCPCCLNQWWLEAPLVPPSRDPAPTPFLRLQPRPRGCVQSSVTATAPWQGLSTFTLSSPDTPSKVGPVVRNSVPTFFSRLTSSSTSLLTKVINLTVLTIIPLTNVATNTQLWSWHARETLNKSVACSCAPLTVREFYLFGTGSSIGLRQLQTLLFLFIYVTS